MYSPNSSRISVPSFRFPQIPCPAYCRTVPCPSAANSGLPFHTPSARCTGYRGNPARTAPPGYGTRLPPPSSARSPHTCRGHCRNNCFPPYTSFSTTVMPFQSYIPGSVFIILHSSRIAKDIHHTVPLKKQYAFSNLHVGAFSTHLYISRKMLHFITHFGKMAAFHKFHFLEMPSILNIM